MSHVLALWTKANSVNPDQIGLQSVCVNRESYQTYQKYGKIPKLLDAKKLCCYQPKIQTKRPDLKVFHQKDANGIANSEDLDQTAPLGAV